MDGKESMIFISILSVNSKAPECINKKEYSVKSDAWAFGILVIEIFSEKGIGS